MLKTVLLRGLGCTAHRTGSSGEWRVVFTTGSSAARRSISTAGSSAIGNYSFRIGHRIRGNPKQPKHVSFRFKNHFNPFHPTGRFMVSKLNNLTKHLTNFLFVSKCCFNGSLCRTRCVFHSIWQSNHVQVLKIEKSKNKF